MKNKNTKNKNSSFGTLEVCFLIIITCIIGIAMGYLIGKRRCNSTVKYDETLNEIVNTYNNIIDNYEGEIDNDKLLSNTIDGMLSSLDDDYTTYLSKDINNTFYATLDGSYEGIGIEIVNDENDNIVVVGVFEDSPAEKAGIKKNDIIKSIDGKLFTGKDKSELSNYISENKKDKYILIIERDGKEEKFEVNKEVVSLKSVSYRTIDKDNRKIGYIYISIFSNTTSLQFEKALKNLEDKNIDALIIDVRENSGGHLTTVVKMLSELLSSDKVIYQIEKDGKTSKYYSNGNTNYEKPIVLIQNSNSASASELFVSALSEQLGAYIIGETSYGKGTVQELNYLKNGDSYKYTTKKWKTSNGIWINEKGIEPNLKVELDENYMNNPTIENDNQLNAAISYIMENR